METDDEMNKPAECQLQKERDFVCVHKNANTASSIAITDTQGRRYLLILPFSLGKIIHIQKRFAFPPPPSRPLPGLFLLLSSFLSLSSENPEPRSAALHIPEEYRIQCCMCVWRKKLLQKNEMRV